MITKDSATDRGIKTAVQAMLGFLAGLAMAIWAVPGVPHAVISYIEANIPQMLLIIGVPSGLVSFGWNFLRKDVPNI